jgi:hypothetical protein
MPATLDELRTQLTEAQTTLARLLKEYGPEYYTIDMWRDYIHRLQTRIKAMEATHDEG